MEKISIRFKFIKGSHWESPENIWRTLEEKINEIVDKINELETRHVVHDGHLSVDWNLFYINGEFAKKEEQ